MYTHNNLHFLLLILPIYLRNNLFQFKSLFSIISERFLIKKKIHIYIREKRKINADERELTKISLLTLYHFSQEKKSKKSYGDLQGQILTHSLHPKITRNTLHNFSTISSGYFHVCCNAF